MDRLWWRCSVCRAAVSRSESKQLSAAAVKTSTCLSYSAEVSCCESTAACRVAVAVVAHGGAHTSHIVNCVTGCFEVLNKHATESASDAKPKHKCRQPCKSLCDKLVTAIGFVLLQDNTLLKAAKGRLKKRRNKYVWVCVVRVGQWTPVAGS